MALASFPCDDVSSRNISELRGPLGARTMGETIRRSIALAVQLTAECADSGAVTFESPGGGHVTYLLRG